VLEGNSVARLECCNGFQSRLLLDLYRKSGLNSKIVKSHFRVFARTRLVGELAEAEFAAYAALRAHDGHEVAATPWDTRWNGEVA
jgi:hypothetical protein